MASAAARRVAALAVLSAVWQAGAWWADNPILFPSFSAMCRALVEAIASDGLLNAAATSVLTLLKGYVLAIFLALAIVCLSATYGWLKDLTQAASALLNPLPAIALLPLAMLWLGLGEASLIFVLCHSIVWPFTVTVSAGFDQVPETLRLVGRNYGLKGLPFVLRILLPGAFPSILSGLKVAWAFAWRTLIASELVFGVSSGQGGLGWFIYRSRNDLATDRVFAGLAVVVAIGLIVEVVVFRTLQRLTVERWDMQHSATSR